MKMRPKLLIPSGAILLLLVIFAFRQLSDRAHSDATRVNIPLVKLETPRRETVSFALQFTGDVVAIQQASIFSKVSGNLDRVYVDMGVHVQKDQLLALIDSTELHQTYLQAEATYENARLTFDRTKDLYGQKLVARQDLDNAEAAMKVAAANFETAKTRLGYARITAPFAGYVTKRFLDPGALISPSSSTLFTLMDLDQMKIIVNVLERDVPEIAVGKPVTITVDAFPGKVFQGKITRLSEAVDPGTRTMAIEIDIPNRDHLLKPGMYATVTIVTEEHRDAVTVPTTALLKDDQGSFVYTAVNDTAHRVPVTLGWEQGERTEIRSGLDGTRPIITTGQQFVRDGGPVTVQR